MRFFLFCKNLFRLLIRLTFMIRKHSIQWQFNGHTIQITNGTGQKFNHIEIQIICIIVPKTIFMLI